MNIAHSVEQGSRRHPDRTAVLFEGSGISYAELEARSNRAANALCGLGVGRGDRVALCLPNIPEFISTYLGVLKIGAITVSLNPGLTPGEIEAILDDSGAMAIVTTNDQPRPWRNRADAPPRHMLVVDSDARDPKSWAALLANASPHADAVEMAAASPAAIVYTSGTTGGPKGVTLSHRNVIFTMESKKAYLGIRPEDRLLLFLPLFHCFGQNAILNAALHSGATLVLQRGFEIDAVTASLSADGVTMFFGVPTTFVLLGEQANPAQFRDVRYFFSAAAPLPVEVERKWRQRFGVVIHQGYGLTETSPFASYNHRSHHQMGSVGAAIDGVEMRVVDVDTGRPLPAGQSGEIVVRGPNVMLGYWNRPEQTREAIRDGWFHTGDIGRFDQNGHFFIEDRLKDMVIVGGFNVYPAEIENVLYQHAAVAEAAAYGVADPVLGERVRAAVVLKRGQTASCEALIQHCRERLAAFKTPAEIELVAALPKNRTGKVLKRVLREQHALVQKHGPAPEAPAERAADFQVLQQRIVDWIASSLAMRPQDIDARRPFADYGLTSMQAVQLARELEVWVRRPVTATITWHYSTVEKLARNVLGEPGEASTTASLREFEAVLAGLSEEDVEAMLLQEVARVHSSAEQGKR